MLLDMDLQDIPKLKPTSLHLRHFSCRPHQVTNTRAIFRVPFQGCGTTRGIDSNHIVYQNVVDNSQEFNTTRVSVRHAPQLYYPFTCRYRQKYVLTLKEGQMREQPNEDGQREENSTSKGKISKHDIVCETKRRRKKVKVIPLPVFSPIFFRTKYGTFPRDYKLYVPKSMRAETKIVVPLWLYVLIICDLKWPSINKLVISVLIQSTGLYTREQWTK